MNKKYIGTERMYRPGMYVLYYNPWYRQRFRYTDRSDRFKIENDLQILEREPPKHNHIRTKSQN